MKTIEELKNSIVDINYIIEEWDNVEVEKPKKQTLILPKKKEIIV